MRVPLSIAWRFIINSKQQSILIALGIAVGVSVQIFIGLLIQGLQESLLESTIGSTPHITIEEKDESILNYQEIVSELENDVMYQSVSASVTNPAFLYNNELDQSIILKGIEDNADGIYHFTDKLISGTLPSKDSEVLVGKLIFEELGLKLNDEILLRTPSLKEEQVTVVGVLDYKVVALNEAWVISTLDYAMKLYELEGVQTVEMQLSEPFDSSNYVEVLKGEYPDYKLIDWQVQNEELLSGLNGQSVSSTMIQVFVMVAVVLGIASVLAITVLQKSKQLGILKAMGIQDKQASRIFIFQGLILGIIGAILGILLGYGLSLSFVTFAKNPDGTPVVPIAINYGFIALSAGIAVTASLIASIIPARASLKLNPIEVIRNG